MSESKRPETPPIPGGSRWLKLMTWVLILLLLVGFPLLIFWDRIAVFACVRLLCFDKTYDVGRRALAAMGWRALPPLKRYAVSRPGKIYGRAQSVVPYLWRSLSAEDVAIVASQFFEMEVTARTYYLRGKPFAYDVSVSPTVPIRGDIELLERVEVLSGAEVLTTFETSYRGYGGVPGGWRTVIGEERPGVYGKRDRVATEACLQQPGQHLLRISVALVDPRLPRPAAVAQKTQVINTVESLPPGYFVPVSNPGIDKAMKEAFVLQIAPVPDRWELRSWLRQQGSVPVAFAGRPVLRIRETGQEVPSLFTARRLPGERRGCHDCTLRLDNLGLEPGRTYHLQVAFVPDSEGAWLDPRITSYWAGELESDWVEVTVPEREEQ